MLRPIGFDIYLNYRCSCDIEYILTKQEAQTVGFKLVCAGCNKVHEIDTITSLKVYYNTISLQKPKTDNKERDRAGVEFHHKVCGVLEEYGYAKKEVVGALSKAPPNLDLPDTVKWVIGELDK